MEDRIMKKDYTIAVAGTGYVGLSMFSLKRQAISFMNEYKRKIKLLVRKEENI